MKKLIISACLSSSISTVQAVESTKNPKLDEFLAMPLEQLMTLNINTSVGKKAQSVKNSAAAVFVISHEDIRRSGVTSIPQALRMVPGLQVAQIDANKWGISSRGFNGRFSTNLLVLMDGKAIYTPAFSGVFWDREDTLMEDIDRIEVIRGAGAAMWGANAVNGVINIITKSAKDTHGGLLTGGAGNQEQGFGGIRYGGQVGDGFDYRLYGKGFKRNNNVTSSSENAQDDTENYQAGFKTQWQMSPNDTLVTQGDLYYSRSGDRENFALDFAPFVLKNQDAPAKRKGGNIQTRWQHKISDTSDTALQVYYKHDNSDWIFVNPFKMREKTVDIDFQHRFSWLEQHDIIWGLGYRYFGLDSVQSAKLGFNPSSRHLQLFSGFLQDDITLLKDRLKLTIGTRVEHNDFTGIEVQPNIRLLWTPDEQHSVWGAISRAVRTPNLSNQNLNRLTNTSPEDLGLPSLMVINGNSEIKSENVLEYELGYRFQPTAKFSFDVAGFYNRYERLQAIEILAPRIVINPDLHIEIPAQFINKMRGESIGVELTSQWQANDWLKFQASYWFLKTSIHAPASQYGYILGENLEKDSPQQQFHVRASLNVPGYPVELDTQLRYVDSVPYYQIKDYVALDMRLGWMPVKNLEFSLVGQNLLDNHHPEFSNTISELPQTEIQRSIFGKVAISF
jgi:iron complex outermembrane receptor protein